MTTSVSQRIHIRKNIQDNSVLNNTHVCSVMCDVLLLCRKQLHDSIISIRRQERANKTRSIPQLIIVASLPSLASIHMCLRGKHLCFDWNLKLFRKYGRLLSVSILLLALSFVNFCIEVPNFTFHCHIFFKIADHCHGKIRAFGEWTYSYSQKDNA